MKLIVRFICAVLLGMLSIQKTLADDFTEYVEYRYDPDLGIIQIHQGLVRGKFCQYADNKANIPKLAARGIFSTGDRESHTYTRTANVDGHKVVTTVKLEPPLGHGFGGAIPREHVKVTFDQKVKIDCSFGSAPWNDLKVTDLVLHPQDGIMYVTATRISLLASGGPSGDTWNAMTFLSDPKVVNDQLLLKATEARKAKSDHGTDSTAAASASDIRKLTLSIDASGIAKATHTEVLNKIACDLSDQIDSMNGEPDRLRVSFDHEKLPDYSNYSQKQLVVYPIRQYAALFHGETQADFNKIISKQTKILSSKSLRGVPTIPVLPSCDVSQKFHLQEKFLEFKQGSGISFITWYGNGSEEAPINNSDLLYTFQGMTADGKYYISFFCPVSEPGLAPNTPGPQAASYLSKRPRIKFAPSLDVLDRVAKSISIK